MNDEKKRCKLCLVPIAGTPRRVFCSDKCWKVYQRVNNTEIYKKRNEQNARRSKEYYYENKTRIISLIVEKQRKDIPTRLLRNLRTRIREVLLFPDRKRTSATTLLGCDMNTFKNHLESLFSPGMSWENYGRDGWHIDHIRPCASFDITDKVEQMECFHYTNLQPLWQKENLQKGAKWSVAAV